MIDTGIEKYYVVTKYNAWRISKLEKLNNVLNISEFQPIVEMCRVWLSARDETKFKKSNAELLNAYMCTGFLPMGMVEKFTCNFVNKFDLMENNDKAKCWVDCVNEYLKSLDPEQFNGISKYFEYAKK